MKLFKRILVPTDFSESSEMASAVAQRLALKVQAEVDLIHVIPSFEHYLKFLSSEMNMEYSDQLIKNAENHIEEELQKLAETVRGEFFIKMDRKPYETILDHAAKRTYDLIVMGSKGEHNTKMRRGGTAQLLVRNSTIPVLTVDEEMFVKGFKHILVPTDGSDLSFSALKHAAGIAGLFDAEITLLLVIELNGGYNHPLHMLPASIDKSTIYNNLIQKLIDYLPVDNQMHLEIKRGRTEFEDSLIIKEDSESKSIKLRTEIISGYSPYYEIEAYAGKHADLVVIATHGYSGFAHLFMGSVTEKVIRYLEKPVLTIRPSEIEFKRSAKVDNRMAEL